MLASRDKFRASIKFGRFLRCNGISGLVVEYIVAIDVTRVRFPADAFLRVLAFCARVGVVSSPLASLDPFYASTRPRPLS